MFRCAALKPLRAFSTTRRVLNTGTNVESIINQLLTSTTTATAPARPTPSTSKATTETKAQEDAPLPAPVNATGGVDVGDGSENESMAPLGPSPGNFANESFLGRARTARVEMWTIHLHAGQNNTLITLTDADGKVPKGKGGWTSAGREGFTKARRASYEAGYRCAVTMFARLDQEVKRLAEESSDMSFHLRLNGFGPGRDAVYRALLTQEGSHVAKRITYITDCTPIKIGGTRAKKMRRI
jgi:small subunit ribosomal protein S11